MKIVRDGENLVVSMPIGDWYEVADFLIRIELDSSGPAFPAISNLLADLTRMAPKSRSDVLTKFKAVKHFACPELKSEYVPGLYYTIHPGNDMLAVFAEEWEADGKIEYVDNAGAAVSRVTAQGTVKWPGG